MDHDATREQLELAAVEPGGLDRLMAGDTASAQAVAGHLAGCPSCTDELARLSVAASLIRTAVRESPSPELRERTLTAIRATGVSRGSPSDALKAPAGRRPGASGVSRPTEPVAVASRAAIARPRPAILGWVAAIAVAVALSVVTTTLIVGNRVDDQLAAQARTVEALEEVTTATLAIAGQPDAEHVALTGTTDPTLGGSLEFSPSTTQLVVVATGLTPPPTGQEYRCWVQVGGTRQRVGRMFFSTDLAYWVGPTPAVAGLSGTATFGVSLVEVSRSGVETDPVLLGQL
jgi:hypothetical protein